MPWYDGPSLIEYLEEVPVGRRVENAPFRFPVQRVVRPDLDFRGYAGQISSGSVYVGDEITVLPSGRRSMVERIVTFDGDLEEAHAPQSITITLRDEVDIARGDLISASTALLSRARLFDATIVWLSENGLDTRKRYRLKHTSHQEWAEVRAIHHAVNINTLAHEPAAELQMNQIGLVRIETACELYFDAYKENRGNGSFILIDSATNGTVAAGMIVGTAATDKAGADKPDRKHTPVTEGERVARWRQRGAIIYLGGRTDLAKALERRLFDHGSAVVLLPEWNKEWAAPLSASGLLVLVTAPGESDLRITTPDGNVRLDARALPAGNEQSAQSIFKVLERAQILLPSELWTESDGI
jgi:hypothetical protein